MWRVQKNSQTGLIEIRDSVVGALAATLILHAEFCAQLGHEISKMLTNYSRFLGVFEGLSTKRGFSRTIFRGFRAFPESVPVKTLQKLGKKWRNSLSTLFGDKLAFVARGKLARRGGYTLPPDARRRSRCIQLP